MNLDLDVFIGLKQVVKFPVSGLGLIIFNKIKGNY